MKQKTKQKIKTAIGCGFVSLAIGSALVMEGITEERYHRREIQQEKAFQKTQEEINAVDTYLHAIDNPEAFESLYMLGWDPESAVPNRYKEFVRKYKESKETN